MVLFERKINIMILAGLAGFVVLVVTTIGGLFVLRTMNQKDESRKILPIIAESRKAFEASRGRKGKTHVTVLLENYRDPEVKGITADHGISLLVARGEKSFVFDLGESAMALANATTLGVDIKTVNAVFISHGHIDHGGGLPEFIRLNHTAPIYLSIHAPENHYRQLLCFYNVFTGLTKNAPELFAQNVDRFVYVAHDTEIFSDLDVLTGIDGNNVRPEANNGVMKEGTDGKIVPDDFSHEVVFVMRDEDGLIVYSGCNHNGILNALETVTKRYPAIPIKAVLGGFHFMNPVTNSMEESSETVLEIAKALKEKYPHTYFYTGHCTSVKGYNLLKSVLGDRIEYFTTGSSFCIE